MSESYALKLCLKYRDPCGFAFLFKKYRKEAYFHAVSLLGNQEDAIDACQESFTRAFAAIPKLTHIDSFYPWFYRILRNCCLNMISRKKTSAQYESAKPEVVEIGGKNNPAFLLEKQEEQMKVWHILKQLNPEFREVLIMKYIEGSRYNEISKRLEIPPGTVMSRLYHARRAFRDEYLKINDR